MSRLIRAFSTRYTVPVQTDEVLEVLKTWGIRDEIWFFPDVEMDTDVIKGQVAEWDAPWDDGTTKRFADISTAKGLSSAEMRLIQCKELLHLLDPPSDRVNDQDQIMNLIESVVAPPDPKDRYFDEDTDGRTLWNALAILFPWQVRELYLPGYKLKLIDAQYIADRLDLLPQHVELVMSDAWPEIFGKMTKARFVPVFDKLGQVELYDIYLDGEWIGSKRTIEQCEDRIQFLLAG